MGRQAVDQSQLFYLFNLEQRIPAEHLLRRINPILAQVLADLRATLAPFYSDIGRPSIDPELMIRMLIVGYCYGIRCERRLCQEVELHLAYRWFCRLDLEDRVPDHSTFSVTWLRLYSEAVCLGRCRCRKNRRAPILANE
jgi:transposase